MDTAQLATGLRQREQLIQRLQAEQDEILAELHSRSGPAAAVALREGSIGVEPTR